jgi:hypothetical protein
MHRLAYLDLDGVVCDDRHRVEYALARDWYTYFGLMDRDTVWPNGRALYENILLAGLDLAYLTGRREDTRRVTEKWLKKHGFDHDLPLIMRAEHDRRPLAEVKAGIVAETLHVYDEVWMYDDDPHVIASCASVPGVRTSHCTWYTKPERMVKRATT